MKLHFVLLTKAYSEYDLRYWLEYHHSRFDRAKFTVIDNESIVDVKSIFDGVLGAKEYNYIRLNGFPDQRKLYGDLMNGEYGNIFEENDAVAFFDDDEYFYLRDKNDVDDKLDYERVLEEAFGMNSILDTFFSIRYDTLAIPHLNISTERLLDDRNPSVPLPILADRRRDDKEATVKCIVHYSSEKKYEWKIQAGIDEAGHVPFVNGYRNAAVFTAWLDENEECGTKILTFPLDNTSFATIDYNSNVCLFHYHIKSRSDWNKKIERGSCASIVPWYSKDIEKNCFYGGYDTIDRRMRVEFDRYVSYSIFENECPIWTPIRENLSTIRRDQYRAEKKEKHPVEYEDIRFADTFEEKRVLGRRWLLENAPDLNIEEPKNLADLIAYKKLYDMNPMKVRWADKCAVYKELYDIGLEDIRIPVLEEIYKPSRYQIFETLKMCSVNDCILKCNHGSGYNIKFKSREQVNLEFLSEKVRTWLRTNYAYVAGYEWHYEPIIPAIIVQPDLSCGKPMIDYQFFCLNGEIQAVELQRKVSKVMIDHIAFTDRYGKDLDWCLGSWPIQRGLNNSQLEAVNAMIPVVEKIAKLFDFVRVDLFWINRRIYFCETTFCPCSGVIDFQTR